MEIIKKKNTGEKKTKYQGSRRSFGEFECTHCSRKWSSAYSWANMGQECQICRINVYPFRQMPLRRRKGNVKNRRPHQSDLCEKCKKSDSYCYEHFKERDSNFSQKRKKNIHI